MEICESMLIKYKREAQHRIFVNRSLQLDKIKFFGFDMDYTLAQYKSPEYETLQFDILKDRLLQLGYPNELREYNYEPSFPIRGLWFDRLYGTFLKMDPFGTITLCMRGFERIHGEALTSLYPNRFIKYDMKRIVVMDTLYMLPVLYMLTCIIHILNTDPSYEKTDTGVNDGKVFLSYASVYEDLTTAVNWMHETELKRRTVADVSRYLKQDKQLCTLLERLRSNGAKVFVLTNSGFQYTNAIMSHILQIPEADGKVRQWTSYFDYIVINAKKPAFFQEGTILRSVNLVTGRCSIGHHMGALEHGQVYSGGSCEVFSKVIGARGSDVLYVGDHIFGDILKSKKTVGWRTYLVVPELANEVYVWKKKKRLFDRMQTLDTELQKTYLNLNIKTEVVPDVSHVQKDIKELSRKMEASYGLLGSMFRNGPRQTFFASQVLRFADLYSYSCINLIYYPLCYMFRAPAMLMPHESTVSHEDKGVDNFSDLESQPLGMHRRSLATCELKMDELVRLHSLVQVEDDDTSSNDDEDFEDK